MCERKEKAGKKLNLCCGIQNFLQRMQSSAGFGCMAEVGVFYKHDRTDFEYFTIEYFPAACWELNIGNYLSAGTNVDFLFGKSPDFPYFSRFIVTDGLFLFLCDLMSATLNYGAKMFPVFSFVIIFVLLLAYCFY